MHQHPFRHQVHAVSNPQAAWSRRRVLGLSALAMSAAVFGAPAAWAQGQGAGWTIGALGGQQGRRILITGANGYPEGDRSGLGYHQALALARAGADVTIASRDGVRGAEAVRRISAVVPGANIRFQTLDLTNLASVDAFAGWMSDRNEGLDLLINNAGVMGRQQREISVDGFERVFATNALGHFALTGRLLPLLRQGNMPRVVWVASSRAARTIRLDDLNQEQAYDYGYAYDQSKLAILLLAFELDRRSRSQGWGVESLAAHPGGARTNLIPNGPGLNSAEGFRFRFLPFLFPPAAEGAVALVYAATSAQASSGGYYGPGRSGGEPSGMPDAARDATLAGQLWSALEQMGGAFPA
jgi:NAD(P)-dependent dehydrogenase (short-subunit alcohol dehydrogenase family)